MKRKSKSIFRLVVVDSILWKILELPETFFGSCACNSYNAAYSFSKKFGSKLINFPLKRSQIK